jgi:hypothetical protein
MTRSTSRLAFFSAGLVLTAALAGCSGSSTGGSAGSRNAAPAAPTQDNFKAPADAAGAAPGAAPQAAQGGGAAAGQGGAAVKPEQLPASTRSIVYNGSITVRVDDVNKAANELVGLATGAGGFVGGDQRSLDAGKSTATLTLRLPADKFSKSLDDISHVSGGKEQSRQVSTEDVTGKVVDLAARIQAQQASVDRVRGLLAKAQTIAEITSVESELSRREADLESLKGQQRSLDDLTALSTIAVTLLGPEVVAQPKPKPAQGGFLGGLKKGWHAFATTIGVILTVLGAVLPFALILGVPLGLVWWWRRRNRTADQRRLTEPAQVPAHEKAAPEASS